MSVQSIDIQILGRTLRVNCPNEQQDALKESVLDLEERLKNLKNKTGVTKIEQLIFIVALNICYELSQEKNKIKNYTKNMEKKIKLLQKITQEALDEQEFVKKKNVTNLE